ncbi:MAG: hypothetical protein JWO67_3677 [Streptosporangiaceae bacterium]|jgi:hypothetical protein|nr:hypothetical protein [Streptosporangiaceae bacterium]
MSSNSHAGRPASWVAVAMMLIGFVLGGAALPMGPNWLIFWIGAGIVVVGGVMALAVDIMSDVVLEEQHQ